MVILKMVVEVRKGSKMLTFGCRDGNAPRHSGFPLCNFTCSARSYRELYHCGHYMDIILIKLSSLIIHLRVIIGFDMCCFGAI